jgi:DUF1707 SHOCT-like domain
VEEPPARVSDEEREQAVLALREHLLDGRLTLDEFSERIESAYRARTSTELALAGAALPAVRERPTRRRRPSRLTAGLFTHVVRRGRLRLGPRTTVVSGFADVDFDLREAEIGSADTAVGVIAAFGNVDVYVPEGIEVDVAGLTVFGHRREWGTDAARPDAPLLRVRVYGLFGTVDVWRVPTGVRGDYGEITTELKRRQRELPG